MCFLAPFCPSHINALVTISQLASIGIDFILKDEWYEVLTSVTLEGDKEAFDKKGFNQTKFEDNFALPKYILTQRSLGYKWQIDVIKEQNFQKWLTNRDRQ